MRDLGLLKEHINSQADKLGVTVDWDSSALVTKLVAGDICKFHSACGKLTNGSLWVLHNSDFQFKVE